MIIFLIGYMGAGKTTRGKQLASLLNYQFIDLDEYIENKYKTAIPILFQRIGESGFRLLEKKSLEELYALQNTIIATGGGAACFFNNIESMNSNGISIYLKLQPEQLARRLLQSKKKRPLIANKTPQQLISYIAQTLEHRKNFYEQAQLTIDAETDNNQKIIESLNQLKNSENRFG